MTSGDKEIGKFLQQWAGLNLSGDPFAPAAGVPATAPAATARIHMSTRCSRSWATTGMSANFDVFMATHFAQHSTEVWALKGKRMVIASEVPDGATWNTQRIKDLTGNAAITARGMRRDNETFARTMTITLLGNSRPKFENVDTAIKARLRIVPFDRNFEAEGLVDPGLPRSC